MKKLRSNHRERRLLILLVTVACFSIFTAPTHFGGDTSDLKKKCEATAEAVGRYEKMLADGKEYKKWLQEEFDRVYGTSKEGDRKGLEILKQMKMFEWDEGAISTALTDTKRELANLNCYSVLTPKTGAQKQNGPYTITPDGWQSTGIKLKRDETFSVKASGRIGEGEGIGPDGGGHWGWFVLAAKVGDRIMHVGSDGWDTADQDGELQLGIPRVGEFIDEDRKMSGSFTVYVYTTDKGETATKGEAAKLIKVKGPVYYNPSGRQTLIEGPIELPYGSYYSIWTDLGGEATLLLPDGSVVTIKGETTLTDLYYKLLLQRGEIQTQLKPQDPNKPRFEIKTPTATVSVKGTTLTVGYDENSKTSRVSVEEGQVEVVPENSALKTVTLEKNQQVQVTEQNISTVTSVSSGAGRVLLYVGIGLAGLLVLAGLFYFLSRQRRFATQPRTQPYYELYPMTTSAPAGVVAPVPEFVAHKCPRCAAEAHPGKKFCVVCGAQLAPASPPAVEKLGAGIK